MTATENQVTLLCRFLSGANDLKHLLFGDTSDLGQWHRELCGLLISFVFDFRDISTGLWPCKIRDDVLRTGTAQSLRICGIWSVQKILGKWCTRRFAGCRWFDVSLLMCLDLLLNLYLLLPSCLLVEFRPQTREVLTILACFVSLSRRLLAWSFLVVQLKVLSVLSVGSFLGRYYPATMKLPPSFHTIPISQYEWLMVVSFLRVWKPFQEALLRSKQDQETRRKDNASA